MLRSNFSWYVRRSEEKVQFNASGNQRVFESNGFFVPADFCILVLRVAACNLRGHKARCEVFVVLSFCTSLM